MKTRRHEGTGSLVTDLGLTFFLIMWANAFAVLFMFLWAELGLVIDNQGVLTNTLAFIHPPTEYSSHFVLAHIFSVCQCSDAWELEMVPWKGGAEFRNNNRYNLAAQMDQFNLIIYVLFCLPDLKAWATSSCPLSCLWFLVQTLPHWWCEEMAITNSFFTGLFVFISLGTLTAPPMGLELCKGAFQGYHVISILPFRSQNR